MSTPSLVVVVIGDTQISLRRHWEAATRKSLGAKCSICCRRPKLRNLGATFTRGAGLCAF